MKKILLILVLALTFSAKAQIEDARFTGKKTVPLGVVEEFNSKILQEKRVLNIYLPQGYHPDSLKTYPVIYLLDGSAHEDFPHIAGLAQSMNTYKTFDYYVIVNSSLWWDEQRMLKKVEDYLSANDYSNKRVFLSVSKEHSVMNNSSR